MAEEATMSRSDGGKGEVTSVGPERTVIDNDALRSSFAADAVHKGADPDADKDEDKADGDGGVEDTTGIFPAARVKRIMRKNPDKKKNFAKDTVHVVALATELFLQDMTKQCYQYTSERKRRTMMLHDVGDCIKSVPRYEFLDGPGILPEPSEKAKKAKTAPPTAANTVGGQQLGNPVGGQQLIGVAAAGAVTSSDGSKLGMTTGNTAAAPMAVDSPSAAVPAVQETASTSEMQVQ